MHEPNARMLSTMPGSTPTIDINSQIRQTRCGRRGVGGRIQ